VNEAQEITTLPDFKGYIHDIGGPTANFREPACEKQLKEGCCKHRQCLFPTPCKNLRVSHEELVHTLRRVRALPRIKKVFIRSGIRFDYLMADKNPTFLRELCEHHISGQLKVAPEHISPAVLDKMGKPRQEVYDAFVQKYEEINRRLGLEQYLVPYLMSSHPGCTLADAVSLAEYLRDTGHQPEQVQDFYPTPGTLSTCMYYTGLDPRTMKPVYVPTTSHEKAMQRALLQWRNPINHALIREALRLSGREDLIGFGRECLVPPRDLRGQGYGGYGAATGGRSTPQRNSRPATGSSDVAAPSGARGKAGGASVSDRNERVRGGTSQPSAAYRGKSPRDKAGNAPAGYRGDNPRGGSIGQPQQRGRIQRSPQGGGSRGRRP